MAITGARARIVVLLAIGALGGAAAVILTHVMVERTGTDAFCGGACHSMQWVAAEFKQSVHHANRTGVKAGCHDCHIPHDYPRILWYKAEAGTRDVIQEMRGVISTEEKFKKERLRLAKAVWSEFRGNDSANCRRCHDFTPEVLARQKEFAAKMHAARKAENKTCIDCHKGIAHTEPAE